MTINEVLSALSGIGAAIAAFLSWRVSVNSARNQRDSLDELKKKNLLDLLYLHAERANEAAGDTPSNDWNFEQLTNIMRAIISASRVVESSSNISTITTSESINYFTECLNTQIASALEQQNPPDRSYPPNKSYYLAKKREEMWEKSRQFLSYE